MAYCLKLLAFVFCWYIIKKTTEKKGNILDAPFFSVFHTHYLLAGFVFAFFFPNNFVGLARNHLGPLLMFCITWAGMFFGCHLETRSKSVKLSTQAILLHIIIPVAIFLTVIVAGLFQSYIKTGDMAGTDAVFFAAVFSTFTLYALHRHEENGENSVIRSVTVDSPPYRNLLTVTVFCIGGGLIYGPFDFTILSIQLNGATAFIVSHLILGTAIGILAVTMIKGIKNRNGTAAILIGACALGGGISDMFLLSPLLTGVITAAYIINATYRRHELIDSFSTLNAVIEKILYFSLGILVATVIQNSDLNYGYILMGVLVIVILRMIAVTIFSNIFSRKLRINRKGFMYFWTGLAGQGALAAAAAIEYRLRVPDTPAVFVLLIITLLLNQAVMQIALSRLNSK